MTPSLGLMQDFALAQSREQRLIELRDNSGKTSLCNLAGLRTDENIGASQKLIWETEGLRFGKGERKHKAWMLPSKKERLIWGTEGLRFGTGERKH